MSSSNLPPLFVQVFLRGGADALTFLPPAGEDQLQERRPDLAFLPPLDTEPGNPRRALSLTPTFHIAPALPELQALLNNKKAIFVHGVGVDNENRSHFLQQDLHEQGEAPSVLSPSSVGTGWLARHFNSALPLNPGATQFARGLSLTVQPVRSFRGALSIATPSPGSFDFEGPQNTAGITQAERVAALNSLYDAQVFPGTVGDSGRVLGAFENDSQAIDLLEAPDYSRTTSAPYVPGSKFASALKNVADIVHHQTANPPSSSNPYSQLEVAHIDIGGWDTHSDQGPYMDSSPPRMYSMMREVSSGLKAFHDDMIGQARPWILQVTTEFGRTTDGNTSGGTDHGRGGLVIFLVSDEAMVQPQHQGKVYALTTTGSPYTSPVAGASYLPPSPDDQPAAIDIRSLQHEVAQKFLCNQQPGSIFPGYTHTELADLDGTSPGTGLFVQQ